MRPMPEKVSFYKFASDLNWWFAPWPACYEALPSVYSFTAPCCSKVTVISVGEVRLAGQPIGISKHGKREMLTRRKRLTKERRYP